MIIYRHVIDRIMPWIGKEKIILLTGPLYKEARLFINLLQSELAVQHFRRTYRDRVKRAIIITRDYLAKDGDVHFVPFVVFPFLKL